MVNQLFPAAGAKQVAVLLALIWLACVPALAGPTCARPDASFAAFLARFKTDAAFRERRLVLPLRLIERGPGDVSTKNLSLAQVRIYGAGLIVADPAANNTGDRETDVCEDGPHLARNAATFIQYTCHSDVYGKTFHFVRRHGCWFLKRLDWAGG